MREQVRKIADEISKAWTADGQPMREKGSREGDSDRSEMLQSVMEELNHDADEDEVSEILAEWHSEQPVAEIIEDIEDTEEYRDSMAIAEWQGYADSMGVSIEDKDEIGEWAWAEIVASRDADLQIDISTEAQEWAIRYAEEHDLGDDWSIY